MPPDTGNPPNSRPVYLSDLPLRELRQSLEATERFAGVESVSARMLRRAIDKKMTTDGKSRPVFRIDLRPKPGVVCDQAAVRKLLKALGRVYGLECVDAREVKDGK